ncbi:MAG: TIGR02391 family protein [Acidimicrobiia bacterium]
MSKRDTRWAREKIIEFRAAVENHRAISSAWQRDLANEAMYHESLSKATTLQPIAWRLITDLVPDAQAPKSLRYGTGGEFIEYVDQALGVLDGNDALEEHWSFEYEVALDTSNLQPWVWHPAKDLWEIGKYKEALHTAALTVNARLQDKVGRNDLEFAPLARNAFSPEPPKHGEQRLRLSAPDSWTDDARKDLQLGAACLGEAVFRLWRNLPAHKAYSIESQEATEALAAISLFARMVEESTIETADTENR